MSSIATDTQQENIQRRRRYCVQDVVDFYKAQTPNRLPKDKEGESKFYRFIYKQISTNGNQLADLIATFKKLGVNILSHIHTKKGKVKQTEQLELLRCIVTSPEKIVDEAVIAQMKEFE